MSMYGKNHYNTVISLQLIKINGKKKESACNTGDLGLIPGLGRSPGEGNSYPLQYSGLENSTDCIVRGVANSWTWLSDSFTFYLGLIKLGEGCQLGSIPCVNSVPADCSGKYAEITSGIKEKCYVWEAVSAIHVGFLDKTNL